MGLGRAPAGHLQLGRRRPDSTFPGYGAATLYDENYQPKPAYYAVAEALGGTQGGAHVTAANASWNGALAVGGSASFGFNGTFGSTNPAPTAFTLGGTACTVT